MNRNDAVIIAILTSITNVYFSLLDRLDIAVVLLWSSVIFVYIAFRKTKELKRRAWVAFAAYVCMATLATTIAWPAIFNQVISYFH